MIVLRMLSNFSSKKSCLLHILSRGVNSKGLHPLQPAVPPSVASRAKRVNDEDVNDMICGWTTLMSQHPLENDHKR